MIIQVPGRVYHDCIAASGVPEEESWPKPTVRRRGHSFIYYVEDNEARKILSHIHESFEGRQGYAEAAQDRAPYFTFLRKYAGWYWELLKVRVP